MLDAIIRRNAYKQTRSLRLYRQRGDGACLESSLSISMTMNWAGDIPDRQVV